jgi:hypothetical protein
VVSTQSTTQNKRCFFFFFFGDMIRAFLFHVVTAKSAVIPDQILEMKKKYMVKN